MTTITVRYKPNSKEKEEIDDILSQNPFFEGRELFKFLLGFYKQNKKTATDFNKQRLQAVAKSFEVEVADQADDNLINTKKKLKPLIF
jgi:hypothetical protein